MIDFFVRMCWLAIFFGCCECSLSSDVFAGAADGGCKKKFIDIVNDVHWNGMFPVRIGSVTLYKSDECDTEPIDKKIVCSCGDYPNKSFGMNFNFWEPHAIIDSVTSPGCFPSLGIEVNSMVGDKYEKRGKIKNNEAFAGDTGVNMQSHYIIFPIIRLLDIFVDNTCTLNSPMDIGYASEIDPSFQSESIALTLSPETLVVANPVAAMACPADAIAAAYCNPIDALFWCSGAWMHPYPFTGGGFGSNGAKAGASMAARTIFKLSRTALLMDSNLNVCGDQISPLWVKSNYRLQLIRPVVKKKKIRIGEPSIFWDYQVSNPLNSGDYNYSFLVFRKNTCCLMY